MPTKRMSGLPAVFTAKQSNFPREILATVEEPIDTILIPPGQKKIYTRSEPLFAAASTGDPDDPKYLPVLATTFLFNREDHTLGNLLVAQLRKDPAVEYVAYKVAHPLHYSFELRVHMTPGYVVPGHKKPYLAKDAVMEACKELVADLGMLGKRITQEWYIYKATREGCLDGGDNTAALDGDVNCFSYSGASTYSAPPVSSYRTAATRNNRSSNGNLDYGRENASDYNHSGSNSRSNSNGDDLGHERSHTNGNNYSNSELGYLALIASMSPRNSRGEEEKDTNISGSSSGGYTP